VFKENERYRDSPPSSIGGGTNMISEHRKNRNAAKGEKGIGTIKRPWEGRPNANTREG